MKYAAGICLSLTYAAAWLNTDVFDSRKILVWVDCIGIFAWMYKICSVERGRGLSNPYNIF